MRSPSVKGNTPNRSTQVDTCTVLVLILSSRIRDNIRWAWDVCWVYRCNFFRNTFYSDKVWSIYKMRTETHLGPHVKLPSLLLHFTKNGVYPEIVAKWSGDLSNCMRIHSAVPVLLHEDRETGRRTKILGAIFRFVGKAPRKQTRLNSPVGSMTAGSVRSVSSIDSLHIVL